MDAFFISKFRKTSNGSGANAGHSPALSSFFSIAFQIPNELVVIIPICSGGH